MTSTNRDQCPRCSALGSATFSSDVYGAFVRCLTCGYHEDLEDERMVTAMEGWRESLRTEWSLRVDAAIARHSEQNPGCRYLRHHDAADELGLSIRMLSRLLVAGRVSGAWQPVGRAWVVPAPIDGPPVLEPQLSEAEQLQVERFQSGRMTRRLHM